MDLQRVLEFIMCLLPIGVICNLAAGEDIEIRHPIN